MSFERRRKVFNIKEERNRQEVTVLGLALRSYKAGDTSDATIGAGGGTISSTWQGTVKISITEKLWTLYGHLLI